MVETATLNSPGKSTRAPASFWVVAALSLTWNLFGAADYTMTNLNNRAWLDASGIDAAMIAQIRAAPAWATAAWAVGVWGSLAGSVLLLLRSRRAAIAFAVSLVGAVVSFVWQLTTGLAASPIFPVLIIALVVLQWWYARRSTASGILR